MPGLDASDYLMFLRLRGASEMEVALQTASHIANNQTQLSEWRAIVDAVPDGEERELARLPYARSIERREALLKRLKMPDPWSYWPYLDDATLYGCAAYVRYGYWQGLIRSHADLFHLAKEQWDGSGIATSVETLGLPVLRERLSIWSMANFWCLVAHNFIAGPVPNHFAEVAYILSDGWWDKNLRGIAWGGGIGKPESMHERRVRDLRDAGHSWDVACAHVYADPVLAGMIAQHHAKEEARRQHYTPAARWRVLEAS